MGTTSIGLGKPTCGHGSPVRRPMLGRTATAGFTLVEMLICIAVIGLLLAILIPVIGRARAAGRLVVCTGNLRQIDQAFKAWGMKTREMRLPGSGWTTSVQAAIGHQEPTDRILTCPDAPTFYSVSNTVLPPGTEPPSLLVEFEKNNNRPHKVTWTQNSPDQWTAVEQYHKNWPDYATFVFTRNTGNDWTARPINMSMTARGGVGPPLTIVSVYNNVSYKPVVVGGSYLISGPPVTPVTTSTQYIASSYGFNVQLTNLKAYKPNRVLVMDYNKTSLDVDTDSEPLFLVGRHSKKHNVLLTDGSVEQRTIPDLKYVNKPTVYAAE